MTTPTSLGIYIGILGGMVYLFLHARKKTKPNFSSFAVIVLSAAAISAGINLGKVALMNELSATDEQKLTMVLGSIAVIWTSIESIYDIYKPLLPANSQQSVQTSPSQPKTG